MQYVYERSNINKEDLKYLDERIQAMDIETKVMTNLNNNIMSNVDSDILRRSSKSGDLRRRREKEQKQIEQKRR